MNLKVIGDLLFRGTVKCLFREITKPSLGMPVFFCMPSDPVLPSCYSAGSRSVDLQAAAFADWVWPVEVWSGDGSGPRRKKPGYFLPSLLQAASPAVAGSP